HSLERDCHLTLPKCQILLLHYIVHKRGCIFASIAVAPDVEVIRTLSRKFCIELLHKCPQISCNSILIGWNPFHLVAVGVPYSNRIINKEEGIVLIPSEGICRYC